jgi:hypothetical protein
MQTALAGCESAVLFRLITHRAGTCTACKPIALQLWSACDVTMHVQNMLHFSSESYFLLSVICQVEFLLEALSIVTEQNWPCYYAWDDTGQIFLWGGIGKT